MNPYNIAILCFGFCSLLLGLLIWLKRQDEIGKRYFLMSFTYSGWAIFIAINLNNDVSPQLGLFMGRLGNAFAVFIPVTWYHFALAFVGKNKNFSFIKSLYIISTIVVCFAFTPWFIPKVVPMVGFRYYSQAGPIYYLHTLIFVTIVPLSFAELYKKMRSVSGYEKQQIKSLFLTALVGYIGGSPTFFPIFGIPFPQYTLLLLPIYPFALAYVMIKQKLFDVEELAQAAHRDKLMAIGILAASINHEIRSPLFLIKGSAENCLEKQKEGLLSESAEVIRKGNEALRKSIEQADRALDIIKRLSSFAKAGVESKLKIEPVAIAEIIENVLPLVRHELTVNQIRFQKEIPEDVPQVLADALCLEEVFFNLIVNACQALKEKPDDREIAVRATVREGKVSVAVQDNGPGISEDKIKDVFRPFYTTKAEGTGLGLYVVKQLVEKNGGRIQVQSAQGVGTIFTLLFPQ